MNRTTRRTLGGLALGIGFAAASALGMSSADAQVGTGGSEPPTGTDSQQTTPTVDVTPTRVDAGYGGAADLLDEQGSATTRDAAIGAVVLVGAGAVVLSRRERVTT